MAKWTGKPTNRKHITHRGNTYYARLRVPDELRDEIGKQELTKSLRTNDLRVAEERATQIVNQWKADFYKLKGEDVLYHKAFKWNQEIKDYAKRIEPTLKKLRYDNIPDEHLHFIASEASNDLEVEIDNLIEQGVEHYKIKEFADIARGKKLPIELHVEDWLSTLKVIPSTKQHPNELSSISL